MSSETGSALESTSEPTTGPAIDAATTRRVVSESGTRLVNLKARLKVDSLLDAIWPPVCLVCGQGSDNGRACCNGCRADMPTMAGHCRTCGIELPRTIEACGECVGRPPSFDRAASGFGYRAPIASLVQRFKFDRDLAAGRMLAHLLAEQLAALHAARPDLMIPVPLNWRRHWRRGFNQAELLCRDLSRHFGGLPWAEALKRSRPTVTQSELPADRRAGNVKGAFAVDRLPPGVRHAVLVDDVMTTGATLGECARVLKLAGVVRVDVWVVARA